MGFFQRKGAKTQRDSIDTFFPITTFSKLLMKTLSGSDLLTDLTGLSGEKSLLCEGRAVHCNAHGVEAVVDVDNRACHS